LSRQIGDRVKLASFASKFALTKMEAAVVVIDKPQTPPQSQSSEDHQAKDSFPQVG
jgi:hypothetical protein